MSDTPILGYHIAVFRYTSLRAIVLITGLDSFDKLAQLGAKIVYSTFKKITREINSLNWYIFDM